MVITGFTWLLRDLSGSVDSRTLNREVLGSNLLAAAVVPVGKALHPHCLFPLKGLKAVGSPWLLAYKQLAFL